MRRLVICAHMDDEVFGLGGSILKWADNGDKVLVYSLCHGRPPNGHIGKADIERSGHFSEVISRMNIDSTLSYFDDLTLSNNFDEVSENIQREIRLFKPDIVYSNSEDDIHRDHRIIAEATKLACRPLSTSTVKELYQFPIPGSTDWNFSETSYNVGSDITEFIDKKIELCNIYTTEKKEDETHPLSKEGIRVINAASGRKFGYEYAETMKLIFKRD